MSDRKLFPSGAWTGFFRDGRAGFHDGDMELELDFTNGRVVGFGRDPIGSFVIDGAYDEGSGGVAFAKTYVRGHWVAYEGKSNGKRIAGHWSLHYTTGKIETDQFLIWPRRAEEAAAATEETDASTSDHSADSDRRSSSSKSRGT